MIKLQPDPIADVVVTAVLTPELDIGRIAGHSGLHLAFSRSALAPALMRDWSGERDSHPRERCRHSLLPTSVYRVCSAGAGNGQLYDRNSWNECNANQWRAQMSKLALIAAAFSLVVASVFLVAPAPASAAQSCQQMCSQNCTGRGGACQAKCEETCAGHRGKKKK